MTKVSSLVDVDMCLFIGKGPTPTNNDLALQM